MIIIYHQYQKVVRVWDADTEQPVSFSSKTISEQLINMATHYPERLIVWCDVLAETEINWSGLKDLFYHKKMFLSYTHKPNYLGSAIGYVDESVFINIKKSVSYPTWLMSGFVGGTYAEVILALKKDLKLDSDFDYFLNSLAKLAQPLGVLCYSDPKLLQKTQAANEHDSGPNHKVLFRFVKQHYKTRWLFILLLDLLVYEKRIPIWAFLSSFFYAKRELSGDNLKQIVPFIHGSEVKKATVDVLIPTIGRKKYLYDFLIDLKSQSHLPARVIIVEQNPVTNSISELDFIKNEEWPFEIKHHFVHQAGACNARNIALGEVMHDWVFFADDDIRIENDFIEKAFHKINQMGAKAVSFNCLQQGEKSRFTEIFQWTAFGSGCSLVKKECLIGCSFYKGYEFGFGEDTDFGKQLRNNGTDILYLPEPEILHLKAPMGGFRTKPILAWQNGTIQPKPSPTVMLYHLLHHTKEQVLGFKTVLFFKYYKHQKVKNPMAYYKTFKDQWKTSVYWANQLKKN